MCVCVISACLEAVGEFVVSQSGGGHEHKGANTDANIGNLQCTPGILQIQPI